MIERIPGVGRDAAVTSTEWNLPFCRVLVRILAVEQIGLREQFCSDPVVQLS